MKKNAAVLISLVIAVFGVTYSFAESVPADQEAQRSRELLEIWKDHVKTLTKERDTAYKEIERLKSTRPPAGAPTAAPMAQFGGIETQPLPAMDMARMQGLQDEVNTLRAQLAQPRAGGDRELQMQFSSLQTQLQQAKKELAESSREKDRIIQEKEKALAQIERLSSEKEKVVAQLPADDAVAHNLQRALDTQKKRNADLQVRYTELESQLETLRTQKESQSTTEATQAVLRERQKDQLRIQELESEIQALRSRPSTSLSTSDEMAVREAKQLRYENSTLAAKTERLQAVEKELQSTRSYFMPMVDELQKKNAALADENRTMKARLAAWQGEMDEIAARAQQSAAEGQDLKAQIASLRAQIDETSAQNDSLKSQLQIAEADKDKYQGLEEELQKLRADARSLTQSNEDMQASMRALEEQVRSSNSELEALRSQTDGLKNREQKASKQVEALRAKLRANQTDMKNLKSNFEAYLDSLVTAFDDRIKTT